MQSAWKAFHADVQTGNTIFQSTISPKAKSIYQNFVQDTTTNNQISLLLLWIYKLTRQQSNLKLLPTENLQNAFDSTTKQARSDEAWGTESGALNR